MPAHRPLPVAMVTVLLAGAVQGHAASGSIDSFVANATTVTAGETVDFSVTFSVTTSSWTSGGSNPVEPAPQEGYQEWNVNWYYYERETLREVSLDGPGPSFFDAPSVAPGASYSNQWSFSIHFPDAGRFDLQVGGSFAADYEVYSSQESATRDCTNEDPGGSNQLWCYWWTWQYSDYSDSYTSGDSFTPRSLTIDVLPAPVPEPASLLLMLAGGTLLARRVGRAAARHA